MSEYKLENTWILWNHKLDDKSWTNDSYKNIYNFENIYDLKYYIDIIETIHLQNSMYFIMKENIFPTWEDPNNCDGCCVSFKIPSKDIKQTWNKCVTNILCENIYKNKNKNYINGISISPKKEFNIIKIWLKCKIKNIEDILNIKDKYINNKNSMIKNN
jgi:hypothetical protein